MSTGEYDDVFLISNDLSQQRGFTLTGVIANEMYFLPAFLKHYRKLGVERFIFIDDQSVDGTRAYLAKQDDVMVLGSQRRYGDPVEIFDGSKNILKQTRMVHVWRRLLLSKYTLNDWSLHVDADEFVGLPDGSTFSDLAEALNETNDRAVWGVMLDLYPASIADLQQRRAATELDLSATWYFDGMEHIRLRSGKGPKIVYNGSRSRLMAQYGLIKHAKPLPFIAHQLFGKPIPASNNIQKPVLLKWHEDAMFLSSHRINFKGSSKVLLPIKHFKFTGNLYRRIADAIQSGSHFNESIEYQDMRRLLEAMEQNDASFLFKQSLDANDFDNFEHSNNALGLD